MEDETIRRVQADNAALTYLLEKAVGALDMVCAPTYQFGTRRYCIQVRDMIGWYLLSGGAQFLELLRAARAVSAFGLVGTEMDEALIALRQTVAAIDKEGLDAHT
jgi:hypothetical protein